MLVVVDALKPPSSEMRSVPVALTPNISSRPARVTSTTTLADPMIWDISWSVPPPSRRPSTTALVSAPVGPGSPN